MTNEELWQAALGEIELSISKANFITWFKNTYILSNENGKVVISVPNGFAKEWLENLNFSRTFVDQFLWSLWEIMANCVQHGHDEKIQVDIHRAGDWIQLCVKAKSHHKKHSRDQIQEVLKKIKDDRTPFDYEGHGLGFRTIFVFSEAIGFGGEYCLSVIFDTKRETRDEFLSVCDCTNSKVYAAMSWWYTVRTIFFDIKLLKYDKL